MFDTLSDRLRSALGDLRGRGKLDEEAISRAMREIRLALLEADPLALQRIGANGDSVARFLSLLNQYGLQPTSALIPDERLNNNASAIFLCLSALARGRGVLVSRGELVAIGGSFKIPEILEASGAVLTEVGTTNRTSIEDYRRALSSETALLLTVHPSNYEIRGYTKRPEAGQIAALAREAGIPWVHDQGTGCVVPLDEFGVAAEPTVVKDDYVKWMLDDPRVNFAISTRAGRAAGISHLGIQAEDEAELAQVYERLARAERPIVEAKATTCCYAKSDKQWIADPQGVSWETFLTYGESTVYGEGSLAKLKEVSETACCAPTCCEPEAIQGAPQPAAASACCAR